MNFVDTNVLIYSTGLDASVPAKIERANEIMRDGGIALSAQVLGEFYVQVTRRSRPQPLTHPEATALVKAWCRFPVQAITPAIVQSAMASARRWELSYWDGAIIEAARAMGCAEVLSEDMSDGQDYGGVVVRNPFRDLNP